MRVSWSLGLATSAALLAALWLIQLRTRDAATADLGWTLSLALLSGLHAASGTAPSARRMLAAGVLIVWASRLALHLLRDRVLKPGEDGRYAALRASWGAGAQPRFFLLYQVQVLMAAALSVPVWALSRDPRNPGLGALAGTALAAAAVAGEALSDSQLAAFLADPAHRGSTCRQGFWRYSRHPNYFFEWLFWWGFVVMSLGGPAFPWTLAGPAVMAFFLFKVTGIPITEAQAAKSRADYAKYQRTTSMFFPWFPKEAA